jgi:hypothetical protein
VPGYDTVVSAAGRNAILTQIDLLKWAEQTPNIKHFLPSEYGTDIEYSVKSANEKPHQLKLRVRAYIKEHVKRVAYTYVVTGPYSELFLGPGGPNAKWGSFDVKAKKAVLVNSDGKIGFTTMPDLGKFVVRSIQHAEASHNKALKVNSFTATPDEILAEFERQSGGKWEVSHTSLDELRQRETEAWEKNEPIATLFTLRRIWSEGGTLYEKRDNNVIDAEETDSLATAVKRAIETQTGGPKV